MKKLAQSIRTRLIEFVQQPDFRPQKDHHLAEALGLGVKDRPTLRAVLRDLAEEGILSKERGNRWVPARRRGDRMTGSISVSPMGHAMVRVTGRTGADAEIFIPPNALGGALHGDTVEVEKAEAARREPRRPDNRDTSRFRPEGRVVRVVERRKKVLVGILMKSPSYWYVIPDHPRINQNIYVSGTGDAVPEKPAAGSKVVVRLDEDMHGEMLAGTVIENLGDPAAPGVDVLSILREHEIAVGFSQATEKEAHSHGSGPSEKDFHGRLDLRQECIITIDPADARDHDDAVSLRRAPSGDWILGVHIADVSHFVTPGSAVDRDAREHGNSVYMVDRFIPMLPPFLTSEVCSLKAGRDRLAYSVFITYDEHATVRQVEMRESVIHPEILLNYEQVQQLIVTGSSPNIPERYHANLREMHDLASRLRHKRIRHGAIDLAMPEVVCKLDPSGRPLSLTRRSSPEAYHLIEEFMLAANVAVADRLSDAHVAAIYRIHEEPSPDQWQQMAMDLQQLGIDRAPADRFEVQRINREFQNQPLAYPVSIAILRNFMRAIYSSECTQHFGLAFDRYTHFTSPIRRYSDLVVHRILKSLDAGRGGFYSRTECDDIAMHCSRREREAQEAEEESLIIKRIQYYDQLLTSGDIGPWPALITGGTARGILVEIVETLQRGFVPSHTLPFSDIEFNRATGFITGRKGQRVGRIGTVISVELMRVDKVRRSVELRWADSGSGGASEASEVGRKRKRTKRRRGEIPSTPRPVRQRKK